MPAQVVELPFLFCVPEAMLLREPLPGFDDELTALLVDLAGDGQLEFLLLRREGPLPSSDRQLKAASLFEVLCLVLQLLLQRRELWPIFLSAFFTASFWARWSASSRRLS